MSVVSTDQQTFLVMGPVGSSHEATTLPNLVTQVAGSSSSVERIMQANQVPAGSSHSNSNSTTNSGAAGPALTWNVEDGAPPSDWLQLQNAGGRLGCAMLGRAGTCGCLPAAQQQQQAVVCQWHSPASRQLWPSCSVSVITPGLAC